MEQFIQINIRVYGVCKQLAQCPMATKQKGMVDGATNDTTELNKMREGMRNEVRKGKEFAGAGLGLRKRERILH